MGWLTIALFFLRFWRTTRDRLFLFFAAAFLVLMSERLIRELLEIRTEWAPLVYSLRLVAFALILIAVADKNSSYWQATTQMTPDMALFFLKTGQPDKLSATPEGKASPPDPATVIEPDVGVLFRHMRGDRGRGRHDWPPAKRLPYHVAHLSGRSIR